MAAHTKSHGHTGSDDSGTVAHADTTGRTADDHHAQSHTHSSHTSIGADDHHNKSHAHSGADGSGTVAHSATTGRTADDHHNQAHSISGADHTGTLAHSALSSVGANDHHAQVHASNHLGGSDDIEATLDTRYGQRLALLTGALDYTPGGGTYNLNSIVGTANEVAIISATVADFNKARVIKVRLCFLWTTSTNGTRTLTLRLKVGTAVIMTSAPTQVQTVSGRVYVLDAEFDVRAVAASAANVYGSATLLNSSGASPAAAAGNSPGSVATNTSQTVGIYASVDASNTGDEVNFHQGSMVAMP